jgi:hypothetical protein
MKKKRSCGLNHANACRPTFVVTWFIHSIKATKTFARTHLACPFVKLWVSLIPFEPPTSQLWPEYGRRVSLGIVP